MQWITYAKPGEPLDPASSYRVGVGSQSTDRLEPGHALSVWGDSGWGRLVRAGKQELGRFDDQLVSAAGDLIRNRWKPAPSPTLGDLRALAAEPRVGGGLRRAAGNGAGAPV